jgi:hypothetical protein
MIRQRAISCNRFVFVSKPRASLRRLRFATKDNRALWACRLGDLFYGSKLTCRSFTWGLDTAARPSTGNKA